MKPTTYINWDGLKDIPFFYCDTKEDEENKDFDIYYQGRLKLKDNLQKLLQQISAEK